MCAEVCLAAVVFFLGRQGLPRLITWYLIDVICHMGCTCPLIGIQASLRVSQICIFYRYVDMYVHNMQSMQNEDNNIIETIIDNNAHQRQKDSSVRQGKQPPI